MKIEGGLRVGKLKWFFGQKKNQKNLNFRKGWMGSSAAQSFECKDINQYFDAPPRGVHLPVSTSILLLRLIAFTPNNFQQWC